MYKHFGGWGKPDSRGEAIQDAKYYMWMGLERRAWRIIVALASSLEETATDFYDEELEKTYVSPYQIILQQEALKNRRT